MRYIKYGYKGKWVFRFLENKLKYAKQKNKYNL